MRIRRTAGLCSIALCIGMQGGAAEEKVGPYVRAVLPHVPKPSRDIIDVACQEIVPVHVPVVTGPSIFMNIQFRVAVPEGSIGLLVYVYDPQDYSRNNFDVVVRYGQEVGFEETEPGSGQGYPVYDWGSFTYAAYEECPVYNNDGSPIQAGDYYFALLSYADKPGGPVGMKACVDDVGGEFHVLADGEPYAKTIEATSRVGGNDCGQQCVIEIPPEGVTQALVTVESAALATELALVVRTEGPIGLDAEGIAFDKSLSGTLVFDALGGYEEVCIPVDPGGTLHLEAFGVTDLATDALITVRFNACAAALALGDAGCADKIVPGIRYQDVAAVGEVVDAVQYRVTLTAEDIAGCPGGELAITVAQTDVAPGEEYVDLLLYCNFGSPIPLGEEDGLPDFTQAPSLIYRNDTPGPGPETIRLRDELLAAGDYWVLVSRDPGNADVQPSYARLCATLTCGASFRRGYINEDPILNIADAVALLGYLFAFKPGPVCLDAGDANDDGTVNVADAVSILGYLFAFRPAPSAPFEACGGDPTADDVACSEIPVFCGGE